LASQTSLELAGISEQNEVMFNFTNEKYNMSQLFTVNLKTYDQNETASNQSSRAVTSRQFSELNQDVSFQQGSFVD